MEPAQRKYLLLSINFSHFAEKARWALGHYGIRFDEHILLPAFHILVIRGFLGYASVNSTKKHTGSENSTYQTPILVSYGKDGKTIETAIQGSQNIVKFISAEHNLPESPTLYSSCGSDKVKRVTDLEEIYDHRLGPASRLWAYYEMLINGTWRSTLAFALFGFSNDFGIGQSLLWFILSPALILVFIRRFGLTKTRYNAAIETCRDLFRDASQMLEDNAYLAGEELSAADIAFASLAYPILGVTHEEGFTRSTPPPNCLSSSGKALVNEFRETKAGRHALRLFSEKREVLGTRI